MWFRRKRKAMKSAESPSGPRIIRCGYVGERDGLRIDYFEVELGIDEITPAKPGLKVLTAEEFHRLKEQWRSTKNTPNP